MKKIDAISMGLWFDVEIIHLIELRVKTLFVKLNVSLHFNASLLRGIRLKRFDGDNSPRECLSCSKSPYPPRRQSRSARPVSHGQMSDWIMR